MPTWDKQLSEKREETLRQMRTLITSADLEDDKQLINLMNDLDELSGSRFRGEMKEIIKARDSFKQENRSLKEQNTELQTQMEKFRTTIQEKLKLMKSPNKELSPIDQKSLELQISKAARAMNAYSPSQIVAMLRGSFTKNDKGDFVAMREGQEVPLLDHVKSFLTNAENDNLIEARIHRSGFDTRNDRHYGKITSQSKKYGKYDPSDPKLQEEAEEKGLSVEDHIAILLKRDERLALRGERQ